MPASDEPDLIEAAPMSASLRTLARRGAVRSLRKGAQLINEGDVGDTLYIVLRGCLRAYSTGRDKREVTYGQYGPGEYVGEMGLDGGPRSANVEAKETTVCALVTRPTLQQHLKDDPDFAFELLSTVISRARQATQTLRAIALHDVYARVKALLERLALPQPDQTRLIDPAPSHKEISFMLGCTREMVTKVLGELEEGGYVQIERRRIAVLKKLPAGR
jgi:CRP/FNR family cyclic AMP-dependent transcriptional regulator